MTSEVYYQSFVKSWICQERTCVIQRLKKKPRLNVIYNTHVFCRPCHTYWEKDVDAFMEPKIGWMCPCCKGRCRASPVSGVNGKARYARIKSQKQQKEEEEEENH